MRNPINPSSRELTVCLISSSSQDTRTVSCRLQIRPCSEAFCLSDSTILSSSISSIPGLRPGASRVVPGSKRFRICDKVDGNDKTNRLCSGAGCTVRFRIDSGPKVLDGDSCTVEVVFCRLVLRSGIARGGEVAFGYGEISPSATSSGSDATTSPSERSSSDSGILRNLLRAGE